MTTLKQTLILGLLAGLFATSAKANAPLPFESVYLTKERVSFKENYGTFRIKRRSKEVCYPHEFQETPLGFVATFPSCDQSIVFEKRGQAWNFFPEAKSSKLESKKDESFFIHFHFKKEVDELFYGLGTQYTHFILNGHRIPILAQEQGNGRGLQPLSFWQRLIANGVQGHEYTTYMAQGFVLSSKGQALFLKSLSYMEADFRFQKVMRMSHHGLKGALYASQKNTAREAIAESRKWLGKQERLPDWIHKAGILGLMGGGAQVKRRVTNLLEGGARLSGVWLQDWVGLRKTPLGPRLQWNWRRSETQYPRWSSLMSFFKEHDLKTLGYFNPYLADHKEDNELLQIAKERGYLVIHNDKEFKVEMGGFKAYLVDLLNPKAYGWLKNIMINEAKKNNFKGWMADFAEAYPIDATNSKDHHRYIQKWQELNNEVRKSISQTTLAFHRAGSIGSLQRVGLFWLGDQTPTYDEYDGLKSTIKALLSSGLNGVAYNHSDIGGYFAIKVPLILNIRRSQALLKRWMEVNAFTMVFRTHLGLKPELLFQVDQSEEMINEYAKWSKQFASLFSYRKSLIEEYERSALPPIRPLFLEFPQEKETYTIDDQFMFGSQYLISPLYQDYQEEKNLYLPKGKWLHLWNKEIITSEGEWITLKVHNNTTPVLQKVPGRVWPK